jgi:hypothetical protein
MSAPVKPVKLEPSSSYIHITSSQNPQTIQQQAAQQNIHIEHKGPVGELEGEHIFEVLNTGREAVTRDTGEGKQVVDSAVTTLKGSEGVKDAKVMETRQRAKR